MVKKLGSAGMLIGGLLAIIGGVGFWIGGASTVNASSLMGAYGSAKAAINMGILGRVGAIIAFVASVIVIISAVMSKSKMGAAIAGIIFGVIAFIANFLVSPVTNPTGGGSYTGAGIGMILLPVSGLVCLIMGIVGLVSKNKA